MPSLRYERKYILSHQESLHLPTQLALHPAGIRPLYPVRQVNNIYFDSPDGKAARENREGWQHRTKYRWRWYGERLQALATVTAEYKHKENWVGYKEQTVLPPLDTASADFLAALYAFRQPQGWQPVLYNSYQRRYYETFDAQVRLTIDTQLQSTLLPTDWVRPAWVKLPETILELKYDAAYESRIDAFVQALPYRMQKHSKFLRSLEGA